MDEERLLEAIRNIAGLAVVDDELPEILGRVAVLANDTVEGSAMVGLTMAVNGRPATPVFTDDAALEIDAAQYESGVGPCLDAFRYGLAYAVPSTPNDTRWTRFSRACVEHGILSTLSMPVFTRRVKLGALNFYATDEGAFDAADEALASAFATQAAVAIANADAYWSAKARGDQLTQALETRAVIEQAKGLLMASGLTSDAAFESLRKASQRENRKLRDVASDLVADAERRAKPQE